MKTLPIGLSAHLATGTTTLCHCWQLTLRTGEKLGFTDHDLPLSFAGITFSAQAGFTSSEIESGLGFSVDNLEASGALQASTLDAERLRAGDFDHAEIMIYRVNWNDTEQRVVVRKGHLGEVTFGEHGFTAEVRGLSHLLNQPKGRLYQFGCDAVLGDQRCGVDMTAAMHQAVATVSAVNGDYNLTLQGLDLFADDWFTRGTLTWVGGANSNRQQDIKRHRNLAGLSTIELWQKPINGVTIGDTAMIKAGCDKQFSTCAEKFFNVENFRGFPRMPGTDFVVRFAK